MWWRSSSTSPEPQYAAPGTLHCTVPAERNRSAACVCLHGADASPPAQSAMGGKGECGSDCARDSTRRAHRLTLLATRRQRREQWLLVMGRCLGCGLQVSGGSLAQGCTAGSLRSWLRRFPGCSPAATCGSSTTSPCAGSSSGGRSECSGEFMAVLLSNDDASAMRVNPTWVYWHHLCAVVASVLPCMSGTACGLLCKSAFVFIASAQKKTGARGAGFLFTVAGFSGCGRRRPAACRTGWC